MMNVPTELQARALTRYVELAQAVIEAARPVVVQELPSVAAVSRLRLRMALDNLDSFSRTTNAEIAALQLIGQEPEAEPCTHCAGIGRITNSFISGTSPMLCRYCDGLGKVTAARSAELETLQHVQNGARILRELVRLSPRPLSLHPQIGAWLKADGEDQHHAELFNMWRCGGCGGMLAAGGMPRPPSCPICGVSWTEKREPQ